jgi:hypothetical protein
MPTSPTAVYLERAIEFSGKTQREICAEVGLPRANALSMMKTGHCKVPVDRIPALAAACGVAPGPFLQIAMEEYHPGAWAALKNVFGELLTEDEDKWLQVLRTHKKRGKVDVDADLTLAIYFHLDDILSRRRRAEHGE